MVPCENSKTVSFAFSRTKYILVRPGLSKFAVKLICQIALGSASKAVVCLNLLQPFRNNF